MALVGHGRGAFQEVLWRRYGEPKAGTAVEGLRKCDVGETPSFTLSGHGSKHNRVTEVTELANGMIRRAKSLALGGVIAVVLSTCSLNQSSGNTTATLEGNLDSERSSFGTNMVRVNPPMKLGLSEGARSRQKMGKRTFLKPTEEDVRRNLSSLEYEVTQHEATEPPFRNRYWDNHDEGIYVDVVTGEPLFSSHDKFDSGTGWPSFTKPIESERVVERVDRSLGMKRTEVRSLVGGSHLGHVFDDGPQPTGLRYCINSAALRFIPKSKMVEEGYGNYLTESGNVSSNIQPSTSNSCTTSQSRSAGCEATIELTYLAGGCFWGMQDILRKIPGVIETEVGYLGGTTSNPTYDDVKTGKTGHAETVKVLFEPEKLSFAKLLEDWFFRMHDPTTINRQGHDNGTQYRSAVFYTSAIQQKTALDVIERIDASQRWKAPIVTEVVLAGEFTPAEDYHQDYLVKHPGGYTCHYLR
jgi:peptide methionine sulfoxide reductase msrA/msrB